MFGKYEFQMVNKYCFESKTTENLILAALSLDAIYEDFAKHSTCLRPAEWTFLFKHVKTSDLTENKRIILRERDYNTPIWQLLYSINKLSSAPADVIQLLQNLTAEPDEVGFYSSLITAYCYSKGLGVASSPKDVFSHLTKAVAIAETSKTNLELNIPIKMLDSQPQTPEVVELKCRILALQVEQYPKNVHFSETANFKPILSEIRQCITKSKTQEEKVKLQKYYDRAHVSFFQRKVAWYHHLQADQQTTPMDYYNKLADDKDLQNPPVNVDEFFESLFSYCEALPKNLRARRKQFYELHFSLTKSPETALRLADLAANGHYCDSDTAPVASNFVVMASKYNDAIDEAINEYDMETASKAIRVYQLREKNVAQGRIDLDAKIKKAIEHLKELETISDVKTQRIDRGLQRRRRVRAHTRGDFVKAILALMYNDNIGKDHIGALKAVMINFPEMWFFCLAEVIKADPNQTQPSEDPFLIDAYQGMMDSLAAKPEGPYGTIKDLSYLLKLIGKHKLHLLESEETTRFYGVINQSLAKDIKEAIIKKDIEKLKEIRTLLFTENGIDQIVNYDTYIAYWLERITFENNFTSPKNIKPQRSNGPLYDIYFLAHWAKNDQKSAFLAKKTALQELKEKDAHPETYLKIAQVMLAKITPKNTDAKLAALTSGILSDICLNTIKAMTYPMMPEDRLGIYVDLAFEALEQLQMKAREPGYTDEQLALVHFYYAIALCIKDLNKFNSDNVSLFESKESLKLAESVFALIKDLKFVFQDKAKRFILTKFLQLNAITDPGMQREAEDMLRKLPEDKTQDEFRAANLARPPINPASLAFDDARVSAAQVPIPVPVQPPSEQVDWCSQSVAQPAPELQFASLQAELAELRRRFEEAQTLLQQKDQVIASKNEQLQQKDAELVQKNSEITTYRAALTIAEGKNQTYEKQRAVFFALSKNLLGHAKDLAALETDEEKFDVSPKSSMQ